MYYYSTIRLILIYRPSGGGRLSRPRHCSKCAARAQSCISQWFSWKHKLLSAARFEPGPSRAAGKRVTTRPLRSPQPQAMRGKELFCSAESFGASAALHTVLLHDTLPTTEPLVSQLRVKIKKTNHTHFVPDCNSKLCDLYFSKKWQLVDDKLNALTLQYASHGYWLNSTEV